MKNPILNKLHNILEYYYRARQVGHTKLILNAADCIKNADATVVIAQHIDREALDIPKDVKTVTIDEFNTRMLGVYSPIIFDNHAIVSLLGESVREIRQQQRRAELAEHQLKKISEMAAVYFSVKDDYLRDRTES
jgi:hypothetical protein